MANLVKRIFEAFAPNGVTVAPHGRIYERAGGMGMRVEITAGGVNDGKRGTVVDPYEVKTDGRGTPTNVQGAYKPVDWSREIAIRLDNGELITMFKNMVRYIPQGTEAKGKIRKGDVLHEDDELGVCKDCGGSKEFHPGDGVLVCKKYVPIPTHDFTDTMDKNFKTTGHTNILGTKNEGKMKVKEAETCPYCNGAGSFDGNPPTICQACEGEGIVESKMKEDATFQCMECGRKFSKVTRKCPKCGSSDIDLAEGVKGIIIGLLSERQAFANSADEDELDSEGGDITTEDYEHWYQYGRLYFTGDEQGLKAKLEKDGFWPNIFAVSDHGNTVQLVLEDVKLDNDELALGFFLNKVGMDSNGNKCVWVARGSNTAKRIQTNGNCPTAHGLSKEEILASPKAKAEIVDYYKRYILKQEAKLKEGTIYVGFVGDKFKAANAMADRGIPFAFDKENGSMTWGYVGEQFFDKIAAWYDDRGPGEPLPGQLAMFHPVHPVKYEAKLKEAFMCQCSDPGCPVHRGAESCMRPGATTVRIDMEDETGTDMCNACAADAMDSGVFTVKEAKGQVSCAVCARAGKDPMHAAPACKPPTVKEAALGACLFCPNPATVRVLPDEDDATALPVCKDCAAAMLSSGEGYASVDEAKGKIKEGSHPGAGGWPVVDGASTHFPGESALCCPKCGSSDVTMRGHALTYPEVQFGLNTNICNACGFQQSYPDRVEGKQKKHSAAKAIKEDAKFREDEGPGICQCKFLDCPHQAGGAQACGLPATQLVRDEDETPIPCCKQCAAAMFYQGGGSYWYGESKGKKIREDFSTDTDAGLLGSVPRMGHIACSNCGGTIAGDLNYEEYECPHCGFLGRQNGRGGAL